MGYRKTISVEFDGRGVARRLHRAGVKVEIGLGTLTREVARRGATGARQRGGSLGGVHRHVLPGLNVVGNTIRLDVRRQPAILGAEFGGGRRPTTQQFPPWRGSDRQAGYMLYPALRAEEAHIDRAIVALIDRAF
jgi:hypothetical protein